MPDVSAMGAEDFVGWLHRAERNELLPVLCSLTEPDRARFAKAVAAEYKRLRAIDAIDAHVNLAVAATCGWAEVKRLASAVSRLAMGPLSEDIGDIIIARRPDWADKFVEQELEGDMTRWHMVRRIVRAGVCAPPASDRYIIRMITASAGAWMERDATLLDCLRADPGLLEHEIWRVFEIDPPQGSLFPYENHSWSNGKHSWGPALFALAEDGTIDRWRLLQAAHDTLRRGLQLRDSGFHLRLIERLDPTPEERARLRDTYLDLLSHRADPVVRFALSACEQLVNEKAVVAADVLARIAPVLQREKKGPAEAALKLMRKLVKKDASLAGTAARAALEALRHPVADVHEKALSLIEELGVPPELAEYVDDVAPSQRARAAVLTGGPQLEIRAETPTVTGAQRVRQTVTPIASFTEWIDAMLFVIDGRPDPIDLERVLDGFSRLAAHRPEDWRVQTSPLLQRASAPNDGGANWSAAAGQIKRLVTLWLTGGAVATAGGFSPEEFLGLRIQEMVRRVADQRSAPLLALPTQDAWIDPRVLVERMQQYVAAGIPVGQHDLVQALLRLDPEHREEALAAAGALPGEEGAAVRYALGGALLDESGQQPAEALGGRVLSWFRTRDATPHSAKIMVRWPIWAAASRARMPFESDANLSDTPAAKYLLASGPGRHEWSLVSKQDRWSREPEVFIEIETTPGGEQSQEWPLSLFACKAHRWIFGSAIDVRHRLTIHPIDPEPALIAGVHSMMDRMFRPASMLTPTAPYLEPLLDPATRAGELGILALALALIAQDADARTMAIDVAIAMIGDGRLHGDELGSVYRRLMATSGFLKLGRVAEAVAALARESVLHQVAGTRVLEELLASIEPPAPKDLVHLLGPYRELLAATGRSADLRLERLLVSITGTGKAAKLAREIAARA